jgi:hypothetical protein
MLELPGLRALARCWRWLCIFFCVFFFWRHLHLHLYPVDAPLPSCSARSGPRGKMRIHGERWKASQADCGRRRKEVAGCARPP